jgi:iron complex outermembrane receptor protein
VTGAIAAYRQTRTQLGQNNAVSPTVGKGVELELRWLASRRVSFTFAGDLQRTVVRGPDASYIIVPPTAAGVDPDSAYGGAIGSLVSVFRPGDYTQSLVPHATASLYCLYTSARHDWGRAGVTLGATYVSQTRPVVPATFTLPSYVRVNGSAFVDRGAWRLTGGVDNLLDTRYFTPVADVYASVAVLPGVGRTWRLTVQRAF